MCKVPLNHLVSRLYGHIDSLTKGRQAELRRMTFDAPDSHTFHWTLQGILGPSGWWDGVSDTRQWAAICQYIAETVLFRQSTAKNRPAPQVADALAMAGYSQERLERLLQLRGDSLLIEVRRVGAFLVQKGRDQSPEDLIHLILCQDEAGEAIRFEFMADYLRCQSRIAKQAA